MLKLHINISTKTTNLPIHNNKQCTKLSTVLAIFISFDTHVSIWKHRMSGGGCLLRNHRRPHYRNYWPPSLLSPRVFGPHSCACSDDLESKDLVRAHNLRTRKQCLYTNAIRGPCIVGAAAAFGAGDLMLIRVRLTRMLIYCLWRRSTQLFSSWEPTS